MALNCLHLIDNLLCFPHFSLKTQILGVRKNRIGDTVSTRTYFFLYKVGFSRLFITRIVNVIVLV